MGGRRGKKKQEGRKGLFQVEVHGSADHPFPKHCSEKALQGLSTVQPRHSCIRQGEQEDISGGCWREAVTGGGRGVEKLCLLRTVTELTEMSSPHHEHPSPQLLCAPQTARLVAEQCSHPAA